MVSDMPKAPRPLRSALHPFGIPQRANAEYEQLLVSSILLFAALRLLSLAILMGVPAVMEHPKEPEDPTRASIWKLPWVLKLLQCEGVRRFLIRQAEFGAVSVKPTHLLVAHISGFQMALQKHTVPVQWDRLITLQGRDEDGRWRTAAGKEYPTHLNAALAYSHVAEFHARLSAGIPQCDPPFEFDRVFVELYAGDNDWTCQSVQPDYARGGPKADPCFSKLD